MRKTFVPMQEVRKLVGTVWKSPSLCPKMARLVTIKSWPKVVRVSASTEGANLFVFCNIEYTEDYNNSFQ